MTDIIEGHLAHCDNHSHQRGVLGLRQVQWRPAGRDAVHQEDRVPGATVQSPQLWVSLPRAVKSASPRSQKVSGSNAAEPRHGDRPVWVFFGTGCALQAPTLNYAAVTAVKRPPPVSRSIPCHSRRSVASHSQWSNGNVFAGRRRFGDGSGRASISF